MIFSNITIFLWHDIS